jgi:hypothetical protein
MELDPNNMATLQAYADVFGVHISVYYKESRLKRSTIICPSGTQVDLRKEEEIKVVSVLMDRTHCTAITNLRSFLRSSASANRSSIHNYCVFCDHIWTSNNQNAADAKAHFFECMNKKKGELMKDTFRKDRTGVLRDIHTRQFFYDNKVKLMRCHTCNEAMEHGVHQGQLDHECYMKTKVKVFKTVLVIPIVYKLKDGTQCEETAMFSEFHLRLLQKRVLLNTLEDMDKHYLDGILSMLAKQVD